MPVFSRAQDLPSLTVMEALAFGSEYLSRRGKSGAIESELFVRHILGVSRTDLYSDPYRQLTPDQAASLAGMLDRRKADEPLQYITGMAAFRDIELEVGPGVLVPRPETEILVSRALDEIATLAEPLVFDVGAGSGAIAISIALERPDAKILAVELSPDAMVWAKRNIASSGTSNIELFEGDLFAAFPTALVGSVDLIVANPPYLSLSELKACDADVREHEPEVAILSGPTGLEVPGRVIVEALPWLRPKGTLLMEISPNQANKLKAMMGSHYRDVQLLLDLSGKQRLLEGRRP